MEKTVIVLVGPKGVGKSHIGTVLETQVGIRFLRVEPIWLRLDEGQDGWAVVENEIDHCLADSDSVIIESLGGSEGFERLRGNLEVKYSVRYVRVVAPLDVCLARVRNRDSANHIAISDNQVERYNQLAAKVSLPWATEITNEPPLDDAAICNAIVGLIQHQ